jgi:fermentation-respiration switch protein FrsA (DUF1100 family)
MIMKFAIGLAVGYGLVVAGCAVMQRSMMYFPGGPMPPPAAAGLPQMQAVELQTVDHLKLTSWYAPARDGRSTIVYFHGNAGNLADRAFKVKPFLEAGYGMLMVCYRGYGGNPGEPTEEGLFHDGRAALAFLQGRGVPLNRTVLLGASLGSGVAVRMASEYRVQGLMLEAPFTSAADVAKTSYPFLPVDSMMLDRFDSLGRIDAVHAPLLLAHGDADRTIPIEHGRRLFAAANEPKVGHFIPGGGHTDLTDFGLWDIELAFLAGLQKP